MYPIIFRIKVSEREREKEGSGEEENALGGK
jgi:hypothetical protein